MPLTSITKESSIADIDSFSHHPALSKCWRLPWQWVLFRFSDEFGNPYLELKKYWALDFGPHVGGVGVHGGGYDYSFDGAAADAKSCAQWPMVGASEWWAVSPIIRVAGLLRNAEPKWAEGLRAVFKEWSDHMIRLGELGSAPDMKFSGEWFSVTYEFAGPCGDATMALLSLLVETHRRTFLKAVGFFLPDDYASLLDGKLGPGTLAQRQEPE
jgi:hypothetical protein